jgi:hypothetical protein
MILYTKEQIAEMACRPISFFEDKIINKIIHDASSLPKKKFILEMRRSTRLNICTFSDKFYYIKY